MTSAITTTNIDETYPIAGVDNNSQGFRDNFTNIKTGLSTAKSEITDLQTNTAKLNTDNDFLAHNIANAAYYKLYGVTLPHTNYTGGSGQEIDPSAAPVHTITIASGASSPVTIPFSASTATTGWPATTSRYSHVRILITNANTSSARTIQFTTPSSSIKKESTLSFPFSLAASTGGDAGRVYIFDAWTYNTGTTVFMKYVGSFA
jgi:hypothetical protein